MIEDEPIVALDLASVLEDAGAVVVAIAATVNGALEQIAVQELDAALLDGNLHGRSVNEVAFALSAKKIPFAFVTGYGRESLPQDFAAVPMIVKPVTPPQLVKAVVEFFKPAD